MHLFLDTDYCQRAHYCIVLLSGNITVLRIAHMVLALGNPITTGSSYRPNCGQISSHILVSTYGADFSRNYTCPQRSRARTKGISENSRGFPPYNEIIAIWILLLYCFVIVASMLLFHSLLFQFFYVLLCIFCVNNFYAFFLVVVSSTCVMWLG